MTNKNLLLSQLISTKLCHDMAGTINATNNALELLAEDDDPEFQKNATELLHSSAKESMAKLKLYRLAYGVSTTDTQTKTAELQNIILDYFKYKKININWKELTFDEYISGTDRQIIAGSTLIIASLLIFGGCIDFQQCDKIITVTGTNQRIKEDINAVSILSNSSKCQIDMDIYNANLHLLAEQLHEIQAEYNFITEKSKIEFSFSMEASSKTL